MEILVNMPAYYEMMISHSPPVFSHSPPTAFLSDYGTNNFNYYDPPKTCRPQQATRTPLPSRKSFPSPVTTAKTPKTPKSCLVIRNSDEIDCLENIDKTQSRTKKKVVFADDEGRSLTEVRVMSEPSNVPPLWSLKFLAQITQGLVSPHPMEQWTIDFRQPASDYLQFREKIEKENVSLENVIVKENESLIVGTVKVKNISFNKEVIVRVTWDDWQSQQDIFCTYQEIYGPSTAYVIFDTFSFKITLPPSSKRLEFCICFRSDGNEFWDNNEGKNYTISKRSLSYYQSSAEALLPYEKRNKNKNVLEVDNNISSSKAISIPNKKNDEYTSKVTTWCDVSSWNQNEYPSPYW